jgi:hypothetical protein
MELLLLICRVIAIFALALMVCGFVRLYRTFTPREDDED